MVRRWWMLLSSEKKIRSINNKLNGFEVKLKSSDAMMSVSIWPSSSTCDMTPRQWRSVIIHWPRDQDIYNLFEINESHHRRQKRQAIWSSSCSWSCSYYYARYRRIHQVEFILCAFTSEWKENRCCGCCCCSRIWCVLCSNRNGSHRDIYCA